MTGDDVDGRRWFNQSYPFPECQPKIPFARQSPIKKGAAAEVKVKPQLAGWQPGRHVQFQDPTLHQMWLVKCGAYVIPAGSQGKATLYSFTKYSIRVPCTLEDSNSCSVPEDTIGNLICSLKRHFPSDIRWLVM